MKIKPKPGPIVWLLAFAMLLTSCVIPAAAEEEAEQLDAIEASASPTALTSYAYNPFYSIYENGKYYNDTLLADGLQKRANCYGYAFRFFYSSAFPADEDDPSYKQQPGEFALKKSGINIYYPQSEVVYRTLYNRQDLNSLWDIIQFNTSMSNATRLEYVQQLMVADANTLGYTVTEYTGTTIPDASQHTDKRLIALVVNYNTNYGFCDYHFYMQHYNGYWSHKPGSNAASDICIDDTIKLTDDNIRDHVAEGFYTGGEVKYYYITKNAIIDFPHLDGTWEAATKTTLMGGDRAGNYPWSAKDIGTVPRTYSGARFDYLEDVDYFAFIPETTKSYTFTVTSVDSLPVYIVLYSPTTALRSSSSQTGSTTFTYTLQAGSEYVVAISSLNQTTHATNAQYNFSIT